jgi:hypothetical protein
MPFYVVVSAELIGYDQVMDKLYHEVVIQKLDGVSRSFPVRWRERAVDVIGTFTTPVLRVGDVLSGVSLQRRSFFQLSSTEINGVPGHIVMLKRTSRAVARRTRADVSRLADFFGVAPDTGAPD